MSDLVRLTIWFIGAGGPVPDVGYYTSRERAQQIFGHNRFFAGIQGDGEDEPEKVKEYKKREAENV